jgi:serine protease Do
VVTVVAQKRIPLSARGEQLRQLLRDPRFRNLVPPGQVPDEDPENQEPGDEDDEGIGIGRQVGSGVVIESKGIVVTNNHVVDGADEVIVRLSSGRELKVSQTKTDPMSDLAVLQVEVDDPLPTAKLGDSDSLEIGDWVIAIGSPFELEATVSAGIISGKGRGIDKIQRGRLLQTDAAINPGNSGGPLVNLDGEVVGINTAIASINGGYQGIGFAIPINRVKWVSQELLTTGHVRRAFLGIRINDLTPELAGRVGLPPRAGVLVIDVGRDGPAERAGLRGNDVILSFAGVPVRGPRDLQDAVEQKPVESRQAVQVYRDGKRLELQVTLEAFPEPEPEERP